MQNGYQTTYAMKLQNHQSHSGSRLQQSTALASNYSSLYLNHNIKAEAPAANSPSKKGGKGKSPMGNTKSSIGTNGVKDWHYETQDPFWPSTRQLTQMTENGPAPSAV